MSAFRNGRRVNTARLWSGGVATAVVAVLIVLAGALLMRGVLGVPLFGPITAGYFGGAVAVASAVTAGLAALVATLLLHLLLVSAPRALTFFRWIACLVTVVAAVAPFTLDDGFATQFATSLINAVTGLAVLTLLGSVGIGAVRDDSAPDDAGYAAGYRDAMRRTLRRYDGRHRGPDAPAPREPRTPREPRAAREPRASREPRIARASRARRAARVRPE
ncbi:DUF6069 family protein [Nocardiopsis trehalosi]|uniref:DUF6069 family protein n=1 Tax=Nocardiopsis trehalosi TaxID=109329 RepID=UPI001FE0E41F|nr:DUF6069 family protein [Nocardiopsis trehalosi]